MVSCTFALCQGLSLFVCLCFGLFCVLWRVSCVLCLVLCLVCFAFCLASSILLRLAFSWLILPCPAFTTMALLSRCLPLSSLDLPWRIFVLFCLDLSFLALLLLVFCLLPCVLYLALSWLVYPCLACSTLDLPSRVFPCCPLVCLVFHCLPFLSLNSDACTWLMVVV